MVTKKIINAINYRVNYLEWDVSVLEWNGSGGRAELVKFQFKFLFNHGSHHIYHVLVLSFKSISHSWDEDKEGHLWMLP